MSAFSSLIAGALASVRDVAGVDLTYRRGGSSVSLRGVPGRTLFSGQDAERFLTQFSAHDWLVDPTALVIDGQTVLPEPGDRIEGTLGGVASTFEVTLQGDAAYRIDQTRNQLRIYTKLIA